MTQMFEMFIVDSNVCQPCLDDNFGVNPSKNIWNHYYMLQSNPAKLQLFSEHS